ncbi:MAG TPA: hypothetical protein ENK56_10300 [Chloroflexi bacterium]|nr:hypothetical protein [Chloroflexota bacterium]
MTARRISGLSLLLGVVTFLAMWGGVTLLLTDPRGPSLPPPATTPRGAVVSFLLFWAPVVTGTAACLTGLASLSAGERQPETLRRALVSILLGLTPACLAAGWLGSILGGTAGR